MRKCLAKDPGRRWHSSADLKSELEWVLESGSNPAMPAPVVAQRRRNARLGWTLAGVFGVLLRSCDLCVVLLSHRTHTCASGSLRRSATGRGELGSVGLPRRLPGRFASLVRRHEGRWNTCAMGEAPRYGDGAAHSRNGRRLVCRLVARREVNRVRGRQQVEETGNDRWRSAGSGIRVRLGSAGLEPSRRHPVRA